MVHRSLPVLSCQYHPEASPGPHDSRPWFAEFAQLVADRRGATHGKPPRRRSERRVVEAAR
jgi:hypothetical protein